MDKNKIKIIQYTIKDAKRILKKKRNLLSETKTDLLKQNIEFLENALAEKNDNKIS